MHFKEYVLNQMNLLGGISGCMEKEMKSIQANQGSRPLAAHKAPLDIKNTDSPRHFTSICWKIVVIY